MSDKKTNQGDDNEELVITETLPQEENDETDIVRSEKEPDDHDGHSDDEDDDGDDVPNKHNDEEKRERRRKERQEQKQRKTEAVRRNRAEIDFLRQQNEELALKLQELDRRTVRSTVDALSEKIQQANYEVQQAENIMARAVDAGVGADVRDAMLLRERAVENFRRLSYQKQQAEQYAQQVSQTPQPKTDPRVRSYAEGFAAKHSWFDPNGKDLDSRILLTIDKAVLDDGFRPETEDYWVELERRASRRLPDKFNTTSPEPVSRNVKGGAPLGAGKEYSPPSTRKEVYISPERKKAMQDLGYWDDPDARARMVKRYAEWDRNNKQQ